MSDFISIYMGRNKKGNNMKVSLLSITPDAEKLIERCTRICYDSADKITEESYKTFLPKTIKSGHVSALSHAMASFHIEEISRACSHQIVRHSHLRYLQKSQRYCTEKSYNAVCPPKIIEANKRYIESGNDGAGPLDIFYDATNVIYDYNILLSHGIPKEDARYILTNAAFTEIIISGSLQAWYDFLRLRLSRRAQWEIRDVAKEIYKILNEQCPHIFTKEILEHQVTINLDLDE